MILVSTNNLYRINTLRTQMIKRVLFLLILSSITSLITDCTREADSLFKPDAGYRADPVITDISPDSVLAGINEIVINGENFSEKIEENVVFFKSTPTSETVERGTVVEASKNKLHVISPPLYGDSILIKLQVIGALHFASFTNYKLLPAVERFGLRLDTDLPGAKISAHGVAIDRTEQAYVIVNVVTETSIKNYLRIKPFGGQFAEYAEIPFLTTGLAIGQADSLFAAVDIGRTKYIGVFPPGEGSKIYKTLSKAPRDLDFDEHGDMWVAADNEVLKVKKDGTITSIKSFTLQLMQIRYVDNSLYILGQTDDDDYSEQKIWKITVINSDSLTDRVDLVNSSNSAWLDTSHINSFALDSDKMIYVATNQKSGGLYLLDHNGENAEPLYPNLIIHPIRDLTWGTLKYLYGTEIIENSSQSIESQLIKIDVQKMGSNYWGREL